MPSELYAIRYRYLLADDTSANRVCDHVRGGFLTHAGILAELAIRNWSALRANSPATSKNGTPSAQNCPTRRRPSLVARSESASA